MDADTSATGAYPPRLRRFARPRLVWPRLVWPLTAPQLDVPATAVGTAARVLEVEQHLTGHVRVMRSAENVHLARVLVDPARRGGGYGRLLVVLSVEEVRRQGSTRVTLRVMADDPSRSGSAPRSASPPSPSRRRPT